MGYKLARMVLAHRNVGPKQNSLIFGTDTDFDLCCSESVRVDSSFRSLYLSEPMSRAKPCEVTILNDMLLVEEVVDCMRFAALAIRHRLLATIN